MKTKIDMAEFQERNEMWQNFLFAAELGTVVQDYCDTVWQKRGKYSWQMVGSGDEFTQDSIQWPVTVLKANRE